MKPTIHGIQNEIPISFINIVSDTFVKGELNFTANEIITFFSAYQLEHGNKFPHINRPEGIPDKRRIITENIKAVDAYHQFNIIKQLCGIKKLKRYESVLQLKIALIKSYSQLDTFHEGDSFDVKLVEQTKHWLEPYPKALESYHSAMLKYTGQIFERNLVDDLRLALEELLRQTLDNHKSLENQIKSVGVFFQEKGTSKEITNMFEKLLDYYAKYQNDYAKHNSLVKEQEIDFILELTTTFIRFLIKLKKS